MLADGQENERCLQIVRRMSHALQIVRRMSCASRLSGESAVLAYCQENQLC